MKSSGRNLANTRGQVKKFKEILCSSTCVQIENKVPVPPESLQNKILISIRKNEKL